MLQKDQSCRQRRELIARRANAASQLLILRLEVDDALAHFQQFRSGERSALGAGFRQFRFGPETALPPVREIFRDRMGDGLEARQRLEIRSFVG